MPPTSSPPKPLAPTPIGAESPVRAIVNLVVVLAAIVSILGVPRPESRRSRPGQVPSAAKSDPVRVAEPALPSPPVEAESAPEPLPTPAPEIDRAAVARWEASLDSASRDRARAEARAAEAADRLKEASTLATADASSARTLSYRIRDPSTRLAQASARGGFLRASRDRLKDEVVALTKAPRPKAVVLADKNPVARPTDGNEFHFEVRRNRVAFIDLEGLLKQVKADAMLRIRLSDNSRVIGSKVGPVGAFSMQYELGRSLPRSIDDLMERNRVSFDLRGWEIIPEFEGRGETYELARQPISNYARAINRLTPGRSTITMWVYPDGFALFRKLRDDLHAQGFLVAARPLPEGMAIRGSPSGSLSAGQ